MNNFITNSKELENIVFEKIGLNKEARKEINQVRAELIKVKLDKSSLIK